MGEPIEGSGGLPAQDPYQPHEGGYTEHDLYNQDSARAAVGTPAIFLLVTAGLHLLLTLCGVAQNVLLLAGVVPPQDFSQLPPEMQQFRQMMEMMSNPAIGLIMNLLSMVLAGVVLVGSLQMRSLGSYGLAMAGAVISILVGCLTVPCCCILYWPAGIWALIVLMRPEVKAAFGAGKM